MWRRVPSGFRFVREAFKPTLTNSMNLMGNIPSICGFVVIFRVCSAQAGSHSLSWLSVLRPRGLPAADSLTPLPYRFPLPSFFLFIRRLPDWMFLLNHWMNE